MIRLTIPSIEDDDLEAVRRVLLSGYLVQGKEVAAFEAEVSRYLGSTHAVAVANCTAALHLALLALEVAPGDAVAVTAYSWPATANVIALVGATPLFVDVDPATFNISPVALEAVLRARRVKAILPVHAFGGMADMPAIAALAERYGAVVVEDAACALGAELAGRKAGTWGTMGCFSFHPRKAVTTGEGGLIVTNDARLAKRLRALRNHGQDPDASSPDFVLPGFNLRLTEFQAAMGVTQMAKLERVIEARRRGAARYDVLLEDTGIQAPRALPGSRHVYQSYVALLPEALAQSQHEVIAALKARGVEASIGTYHMPMTTWFRQTGGHAAGAFPVTDSIAARAVALPLFESLSAAQQATVVAELAEAVARPLASAARATGR